MSLKAVKKLLNIDQRNILTCTVVNDLDTSVTVRTSDGKTVKASKQGGSFAVGSQVEVRTDGISYSIVGSSSYSEYSADRDYAL